MGTFNIEWQIFERRFSTYFYELARFNFSITNPVFWLFFLALLLILLKSWKINKAFSFCFIIAAVLLSATKIENYIVEFFRENKEPFDPLLIRISCVALILIISLYYFFIKTGND